MEIGVIGPKDSVEQAILATEEFKVKALPLVYQEHQQIIPLIHDSQEEVDGYLFTGKVPYLLAKQQLDFGVPVKYVEHDNTTLHRILFHIRYHHHLEITRFSIDLFKKEEVQDILNELEIPFKDIYVQDFDLKEMDNTKLFHINLYRQGKVDYCITPMLSTFERLKKEQIPVFRVVPTKFAIRNALEMLLLEIENILTEEAQISVGIFNVDNFKHVTKEYPEYELQMMKLKLYEWILQYGQETNSSTVFTGGDEFFIYSTKGEVSKGITGQHLSFLFDKIRKDIPFTVSYGIGEGANANEATNNARIALRKAKNSGGNSVYLRQKNGVLTGPLLLQRDTSIYIKLDDKLEQISEEIGMSISTISKIKSIKKNHPNEAISSNEFANAYGCSIRSARRILSMLEKYGYACVEKQDQIYEKGRKRRYYKLKL